MKQNSIDKVVENAANESSGKKPKDDLPIWGDIPIGMAAISIITPDDVSDDFLYVPIESLVPLPDDKYSLSNDNSGVVYTLLGTNQLTQTVTDEITLQPAECLVVVPENEAAYWVVNKYTLTPTEKEGLCLLDGGTEVVIKFVNDKEYAATEKHEYKYNVPASSSGKCLTCG
jgi:hypothetical protein